MFSLSESSDASAFSNFQMPDVHEVRKTALVFRALNHPLRQKMLLILLEKSQLTVTELFQELQLEQSVASQHLAILRRTGFVKNKREGKHIWYMAEPERLQQIKECVKILLNK